MKYWWIRESWVERVLPWEEDTIHNAQVNNGAQEPCITFNNQVISVVEISIELHRIASILLVLVLKHFGALSNLPIKFCMHPKRTTFPAMLMLCIGMNEGMGVTSNRVNTIYCMYSSWHPIWGSLKEMLWFEYINNIPPTPPLGGVP